LVLSGCTLTGRTSSLAAAALAITVTTIASAGVEGSVSPRQASPGAIRGRVRFPETSATVSPRPSVSDLGGSEHPAVDRRTSVVYLDAVPRQAFDELPAGRVRMDQREEQFVPRLLAITVGTIVDFPNSDTKFHNVFSLSKTHPFDLGRYPPGKSGFERFDRPGLVRVFCDIHSHMSGYILVFSHRYFAVTDVDGRYAIPRVPPGTYTLMVWSELGSAEPRRITVTDGTIAEADFQVGRAP
jgi:plastocyanin